MRKTLFILSSLLLTFGLQIQTLFAQESSSSSNSDSGWVQIKTNLERFLLVVDNDYEHFLEVENNSQIRLPAGSHELLVVWENINDWTSEVVVVPDFVTQTGVSFAQFYQSPEKSSYKTLTEQRNVIIRTDRESDIYLNNEFIGTGYTEAMLPDTLHSLRITHPEYGSLQTEFVPSFTTIQELNRYNINYSPIPSVLKILPGVGYLSQGKRTAARNTYLALATTIGFSTFMNYKVNDLGREIAFSESKPHSQQFFDVRIQPLIDKQKRYRNYTKIGLMSSAIVYAYTAIHGFRKPKDGYPTPPKSFRLEQNASLPADNLQLTIAFNF